MIHVKNEQLDMIHVKHEKYIQMYTLPILTHVPSMSQEQKKFSHTTVTHSNMSCLILKTTNKVFA